MNMPFDAAQFFGVFARYNGAVWPMQLALNLIALLVVWLVWRARPASGRWIATLLAFLWAWMALAYQFAFFTAINPAAWMFGAVFLLGALAFVWAGVVQARLRFAPASGWRGWAGGALVLFALLVYPLLGQMLGHRYPAVPTFGLPCPTTLFTIGVLLFAQAPLPRSVFIVPVLWAMVGASAAFTLGVYQDLGLLAAGVIGVVVAVRPPPPAAPFRPA